MDSKLVLAAAAFAVSALGAGTVAVVQGGEDDAAAATITSESAQPSASAVQAANHAPAATIECESAMMPTWAQHFDTKIDLARRTLLREIYDKMRSEAVVKAGACSCELYHMPYSEAETVFEAMVGESVDPAAVNDMKRSVWKEGEKARAAARSICKDYRW